MNTQLKDLTLFEKFAEPNEAIVVLKAPYVDKMTGGHYILSQFDEIRKWVANNIRPEYDPFWPKFGNKGLVNEILEARQLEDDEFGLVWRDVIILYYKRLGRCCYISREFSEGEEVQFITELKSALFDYKQTTPPKEYLSEEVLANKHKHFMEKMERNVVYGIKHNELFGSFGSKKIQNSSLYGTYGKDRPALIPDDLHRALITGRSTKKATYFDSLTDLSIRDTLSKHMEVVHPTNWGLKSTQPEDQIPDLPCKYRSYLKDGIGEKEYFKISEMRYAIRNIIDNRTASAFVDMPEWPMQRLFHKAVYPKASLSFCFMERKYMYNWINGFIPNYIPRSSAAVIFGPYVGPYTPFATRINRSTRLY